MDNSKTIKIIIGLVCTLLVIAGVVWFFVFKTYQGGPSELPTAAVEPTPEPTPEPTATPVPTPTPIPFDESRLGNPMRASITVPTDLASSLGITRENYPRIDGSTSTFELAQSIYWMMIGVDENADEYPEDLGQPKAPAKTIPSYKYLIAGDVDLIVVPDPSQEVKDLEKESGVELEYIPIGREGLVFITSKTNPVSDITIDQANEIYVDMTITNWSQLGGEEGEILVLCRNEESGSQAQFDNLVMKDGNTINPIIREKYTLDEMSNMLWTVSGMDPWYIDGEPAPANDFPLGYSIYYYLHMDYNELSAENIRTLSVNGITPTAETIASNEYPLAMGYFAVIRKDTPQDAPARIIANWLTTEEGQRSVSDAGLGKISK